MKKFLFSLMMGLLLFPNVVNAQFYMDEQLPNPGSNPPRSPASCYVIADLGEATGILTLLCVGNVGSMEVTISQNGVNIENDVIAVSNGQSVIYNLSGYAIGEYLLTIETADGAITQYIIYVEDD